VSAACSCGNAAPHEVARRRTFDDFPVVIWSDGRVTDRMGTYCPGGGVPAAFRADFIDMICVHTWTELSTLIRASKRVCGRKLPADLRAAVLAEAFPVRKEPGAPWSATQAYRDMVEHIRSCRAIHCRVCG
jgi:hypothetical protein